MRKRGPNFEGGVFLSLLTQKKKLSEFKRSVFFLKTVFGNEENMAWFESELWQFKCSDVMWLTDIN